MVRAQACQRVGALFGMLEERYVVFPLWPRPQRTLLPAADGTPGEARSLGWDQACLAGWHEHPDSLSN